MIVVTVARVLVHVCWYKFPWTSAHPCLLWALSHKFSYVNPEALWTGSSTTIMAVWKPIATLSSPSSTKHKCQKFADGAKMWWLQMTRTWQIVMKVFCGLFFQPLWIILEIAKKLNWLSLSRDSRWCGHQRFVFFFLNKNIYLRNILGKVQK